jgi:threonylcarbamoyladenosine tRNA methylthiotransferase MtaB
VDTCRRAIEAGYKEIVLTGTHIGRFADSEGNRLPVLINRIAAIEGDFRIRLSSLDPVDCSDELLELVAHSDKVCRHLHVSLQSCCAEVLVAMNRPWRETLDCIERLVSFRKSNPSAGIGVDIIAGFPGETDAMFGETCCQVERIGLSYAHVFRFSPRPGTDAALFDNRVAESVKRERSGRLRRIVESARERFLKSLEGTVQRIIVESGSPLRELRRITSMSK